MSQRTDWMPGARVLILAMYQGWLIYMTEERRILWGVPPAEYTALGGLCTAAFNLLQMAQNQAERTHVITVECQVAF